MKISIKIYISIQTNVHMDNSNVDKQAYKDTYYAAINTKIIKVNIAKKKLICA